MKTIKLLYFTLMLILLASCSSEIMDEVNWSESPYLSIEGTIDINTLSAEELQTLASACERIKIIVNNKGLYELTPHTARKINVSENIYNFFKEIVKSSNDNFEISRNCLISRDPIGYGSDCAVYAISYATGMSYYDVFNHVLASTGLTGVNSSNMNSVFCDPRFGGNTVDKDSFTSPESLGNRYVIIYHDPESMDDDTWHAVNGYLQNSSSQMICFDNQNRCFRIVETYMIQAIYYY